MQHFKWITLGVSILCLIAVATVNRAQHLYYMAALLLTLPAVSYFIGWYTLKGVEFSRELPSVAWEGEESTFRYIAKNHTQVPKFFLSIHERLPNWIVAVDKEATLFNLQASAETPVSASVKFRKRGVYQVSSFDVSALDPLGIFAFAKRIPSQGELVVYPQPKPLSSFTLTGVDHNGWLDFVRQALMGSSVEPDGVRSYVPGDSLRRIHWRQTARTGQLSVIEFEEAQAINLVVALDTMRGSEVGKDNLTTLEYGVQLAASVAYEAIRQGASVQVLTAPLHSDTTENYLTDGYMSSGRGQSHFYAILDRLARVQADSVDGVEVVLENRSVALASGATLLVITSRIGDSLYNVLDRHKVRGGQVILAYVDPDTFQQKEVFNKNEHSQAKLDELNKASVNTFIFRSNQEALLYPEAALATS